jgi:hypothetical protein
MKNKKVMRLENKKSEIKEKWKKLVLQLKK